jgi:hypothetical protein
MRMEEKIMTKSRMISLKRSLYRRGKKTSIGMSESVYMHIPLTTSLSTYELGSEQEERKKWKEIKRKEKGEEKQGR